jgi:CheY-like chemotaxis protein
MSLIETSCPKCDKTIFLDLEEIVSDSSSRPIKCSQCGNEFIFGFDADIKPVVEDAPKPTPTSNTAPTADISKSASTKAANYSINTKVPPKKKTKLVKKIVKKMVKKQPKKANNKVLVIEDSRLTREQIGDLFEETVTDVVKVERAEDGFKSIKERMPDLLIVDLVLPKMSGIDFLNTVLKYVKAEKIIIFTATMGMHTDIFDSGMEGVTLIQKEDADSYEELQYKGLKILGL